MLFGYLFLRKQYSLRQTVSVDQDNYISFTDIYLNSSQLLLSL